MSKITIEELNNFFVLDKKGTMQLFFKYKDVEYIFTIYNKKRKLLFRKVEENNFAEEKYYYDLYDMLKNEYINDYKLIDSFNMFDFYEDKNVTIIKNITKPIRKFKIDNHLKNNKDIDYMINSIDNRIEKRELKYIDLGYWNIYKNELLIKTFEKDIKAFEWYAEYEVVYKCEVNNIEITVTTLNEVLKYIFDYPESFVINNENRKYYTKRYLKEFYILQEKCLLDNLKDIKSKNDYNNEELSKRNYYHLTNNIDKEINVNAIKNNIPQYSSDNLWYVYQKNSIIKEYYLVEIITAFENYANISFYYPFEIGENHGHHHDFEYILTEVYDYPESFYIRKEHEQNYSENELIFIYQIKRIALLNYLKNINNIQLKTKNIDEYNKRNYRLEATNYIPEIMNVNSENAQYFIQKFNLFNANEFQFKIEKLEFYFYIDSKKNIAFGGTFSLLPENVVQFNITRFFDDELYIVDLNEFVYAIKEKYKKTTKLYIYSLTKDVKHPDKYNFVLNHNGKEDLEFIINLEN